MKVLHLCPLWLPVGRDSPGGIETFLTTLVAELERLGCENTLLASGDSEAVADVIPVVEAGIVAGMEASSVWEYGPYEQHQLLSTLERAADFDVVHSFIGWAAYALSGVEQIGHKLLHTLEHPVTPDLEWLALRHPDLRISVVSEHQAQKLRRRGVGRCYVVPNGIEVAAYEFSPGGEDGLVYVGRMEAHKGPDLAVQVARTLGEPLALAGPMTDPEYFDERIRPWLNDRIQYVGVLDHRQKNTLFGGAACALMPSRWEEPFGLVAVEAMACGTPVVGLRNGALPEVIDDGVTGYVGEDEDDLTQLVPRAVGLDRTTVRAHAARRFDIARVARQYLELYGQIVGATPGAS